MSALSQLVFYGELLPGHDAEAAKASLAELLKLSQAQISSVFSGRRVVLRKQLPSEQAAAYVARLAQIGIKALIEPLEAVPAKPEPNAAPDTAASVPAVATVAVPPAETAEAAEAPESKKPMAPLGLPGAPELTGAATAPAVETAAVEEMECPKCGERQPRRTLCRACSVDMRRFAEAQQEAEQAAREQRMLDREIALASRGGRYAAAVDPDAVGVFGFGFDGRLGRVAYLVGALMCWAILGFAGLAWLKLGSFAAALAGVGIACIVSLRLSFLRCHDINRSGWFVLLQLIPYLGVLFALALLFIPGTRGDNDYGAPGRKPGLPLSAGLALVFAIAMGTVYSEQSALMSQYAAQMAGYAGHSERHGGGAFAVADADVEIFTTTDCSVCHAAKAYMDARGISYAEKNVEENEDYLREFYARGGRGVPYIFVGNQSMSGFSPQRLEQMLGNSD